MNGLFDSTTIPVLEQVVAFTQARHGVLAGNVANLDTPGYRTRDLSPGAFEEKLKEAIQSRNNPAPRSPGALPIDSGGHTSPGLLDAHRQQDDFREVKDSMKSILYHDESDVAIEKQITEIAKNQSKHNLALSLMVSQFRLLQAAISERV